MQVADHFSAVKRRFESRAMPAYEKPSARLVDIYYVCNFFQNMPDCAYCRFDLRTGVPMGVYFCGILDNRFERKSILWVNTLEQMVSVEKQVIT